MKKPQTVEQHWSKWFWQWTAFVAVAIFVSISGANGPMEIVGILGALVSSIGAVICGILWIVAVARRPVGGEP